MLPTQPTLDIDMSKTQNPAYTAYLVDFKNKLSNYPAEAHTMWDNNPFLQHWYTGQSIDFGSAEQTDIRTIPPNELINDFKSILASQVPHIIKTVWEKNPVLKNWYSGQPINFGSNTEAKMDALSPAQLIHSFKVVLKSRCVTIINFMWTNNAILQDWYNSQPVNFGSTEQVDMRIISMDSLISDFKSALSSQLTSIIITLWKGSALLQAWYTGQPVNFASPEQPKMSSIPCSVLFADFKHILASRSVAIITAIWQGNAALRDWYANRPINFNIPEQQPHMQIISLSELIEDFKSILASRVTAVVNDIWETNSLLKAWYSNQPINFNTLEAPDIRTISPDELINNFSSFLTSRVTKVITTLWESNAQLQAHYLDQTLARSAQLSNFQSILASRCEHVIDAIWEKNQKLRDDIRSLNFNDSTLLLKKVLSSSKKGTGDFLIKYLTWLENVDVKNSVLNEIITSGKGENVSRYKKRKIDLMKQHITTDIAPDKNMIEEQEISKVKSPHKKNKLDELNLNHLIEKLPFELNLEQPHFNLEKNIALQLKKLSVSKKNEFGIYKITKIRNQFTYRVELSDPSQYKETLKKYTNSPSITMEPNSVPASVPVNSPPSLFGYSFNASSNEEQNTESPSPTAPQLRYG